jgi:hypothetical protein
MIYVPRTQQLTRTMYFRPRRRFVAASTYTARRGRSLSETLAGAIVIVGVAFAVFSAAILVGYVG